MPLDHTFTITDASAPDYRDATKLCFSPPSGGLRAMPSGVVALAYLSTDSTDFVAITDTAAAGLAVQLTRALGVRPQNDLLALSRNVGGDAITPAVDPRDDLLRRAMDALSEYPNSAVAEGARLRVAVDIARHLLDAGR